MKHPKGDYVKNRKRSLLLSVGLVLTGIFLLSILLNSLLFRNLYYDIQTQKLQNNSQLMIDYVRDELYEYKALPWLMSYWETNYADMDIPLGAMDDEGWRKRHSRYLGSDIEHITGEEAEALLADEKKEFAEVCYVRCAEIFYEVKSGFDLYGITCTLYTGGKDAFVYFASDLGNAPRDQYVLGERWPFNIELHPVAKKIYETGEDLSEFEFSDSTTDGENYMYLYSPVIVDGKLLAVVCQTYLTQGQMDRIKQNEHILVRYTIRFFFAVFVLIMFQVYFWVIRPLLLIQRSVNGYKDDKDSSHIRDRLSGLMNKKNELGTLAEDVSLMAVEMDRYVEDIRAVTAEKERIGAELNMASSIQSSSLPHDFPAFPDRDEFDIYATMNPAKEVGGDFYDFFLIDDDHLALVVADVSGKGVPAALFMMVSKTVIRSLSQLSLSPKDILGRANATLYQDNEEFMFVTVWLGILEISTGELTYADAGHEKLAIYHDGQWRLIEKETKSPALGLVEPDELMAMGERNQFKDMRLTLSPGDAIMQYTDGVTEAADSAEELFREERLLAALASSGDPSPESLLVHIKKEIDDFVQDAQQFDDITMLALLYRG